MNSYQETESGSVPNIENNLCNERKNKTSWKGRLLNFNNDTLGGNFKRVFLEHEVLRIIEQPLRALNENKNQSIVKEAEVLISNIIELSLNLQRLNIDTSSIAPLHASNLEDGSLLIEWIFPNYRIGFAIESNSRDSSWYLVSTNELVDSNASGSLSDIDKKEFLPRLFYFVASHS
jgi:hypothetical protein